MKNSLSELSQVSPEKRKQQDLASQTRYVSTVGNDFGAWASTYYVVLPSVCDVND